MRFKLVGLLVTYVMACTPVPPRPSPVTDFQREEYENCGRQHAVCLKGNAGGNESLSQEAQREQYEIYGDRHGFLADCNKKLKACYERVSKNLVAPSH